MYYVIFFAHLVIAALLMVVVLLQRSKGNGLAGAFGGMGAGEAMFGAQGVTTFLHKATIYLAAAFMLTSLTLAYLTAAKGNGGSSVVRRAAQQVPVTPTAVPMDAAPVVPITGGAETAADEGATTAGQEATDDVVPPAPESGAAQTEGAGTTGSGSGGDESGGR